MSSSESRATVLQINISPGGVPKLPVHLAAVGEYGIEGDGHTYAGHGGPEKALCLYSLERILDLQREGHPIYPGSTGENLTIAGLDWDLLEPGVRLTIGESVVAEIVSYTEPCRKIAASFRNGEIRRMAQSEFPGWARLYAKVQANGAVRPGDPVAIIDSPSGGKE
jgi:MOSC domain-containing protein YiiM